MFQILLLSMKDMNVAKLTSADLPLFNGIISDLFPGIESPVVDYSKVGHGLIYTLKLFKTLFAMSTSSSLLPIHDKYCIVVMAKSKIF